MRDEGEGEDSACGTSESRLASRARPHKLFLIHDVFQLFGERESLDKSCTLLEIKQNTLHEHRTLGIPCNNLDKYKSLIGLCERATMTTKTTERPLRVCKSIWVLLMNPISLAHNMPTNKILPPMFLLTTDHA